MARRKARHANGWFRSPRLWLARARGFGGWACDAGTPGSCPACITNFVNYYCTTTCSPDQSLWYKVEATKPSKSGPGKRAITEATVYVNETFAQQYFDSCANVKMAQSGQTVRSQRPPPVGAWIADAA